MALIMLRFISSLTACWEFLSQMDVDFFCIYWDDHMIFIHFDLHLCIPGLNLIWSLCIIALMYCSLIFCGEFFASVYIREIFLCVLVWFWYQGNASFIKWVWKTLVLFLEDFEQYWYYFFNCLVECLSEATWSWIFVCWEVRMSYSSLDLQPLG